MLIFVCVNRKVQSLTADLELAASKLQNLVDETELWNKESRLTLKTNLSPTKNIIRSFQDVDKSAIEVLKRLVTAKQSIVSKDNRNRISMEEKDIEKVQNVLNTAVAQGIKAEELLTAAKSVGDRESSAYLKKSTSKTPLATALNGQSTFIKSIK